MRCLLSSSEHASDAVPEALASAGIEFVRSKDLRTDWLTEDITDIDFLCAVLDGTGRDEPPAIYLEIGVALGRELPVLIIAEPNRRIPLAIAGLQRVEVDLRNTEAIAHHLHSFTSALDSRRLFKRDSSRSFKPEKGTAARLRAQLEALSLEPNSWGSNPAELGYEYQRLVHNILSTAGAEPSSSRIDEGFDLAAWIDHASEILGGPILVQCKIATRIDRKALQVAAEKFTRTLSFRSVKFGLIVYHSLENPHHQTPLRTPYPVWAFSASELINMAEQGSLSDTIITLRNELMHRQGS
ncbi:hypothetical protein GCM10010306_004300 [Streptomyces umbrinus]|uniref:hypothetical protein n=1 Tax=Streptomyces umbrinus TaxID=67370 RepID=UPI00167B8C03|nr:hypothetical protein [Streptomyces umbrinus]GHB15924.1 hypothetical protein GCM10010306_004300 [Streptomyces umbrinus]